MKERPKKPSKSFPLFAHRNGQWAKKINGKHFYFGTWNDPNAALSLYKQQRNDLEAGVPVLSVGDIGMREYCNLFMAAKVASAERGEIRDVTVQGYLQASRLLVKHFGKQSVVKISTNEWTEFRAYLKDGRSWRSVKTYVVHVRAILKWGFDQGIFERPVRDGKALANPSLRLIREEREANDNKSVSPDEIKRLMASVGRRKGFKAMILLGINAGYGNNDVSTLRIEDVDFQKAEISRLRPKTGIRRRNPLWPETLDAMQEYLAWRPQGAPETMFITSNGRPWGHQVTKSFRAVKIAAGIDRKGLGFYSLRHMFFTIAEEVGSSRHVSLMMGHADSSVKSAYRETNTRRDADGPELLRISEHVRCWLFE